MTTHVCSHFVKIRRDREIKCLFLSKVELSFVASIGRKTYMQSVDVNAKFTNDLVHSPVFLMRFQDGFHFAKECFLKGKQNLTYNICNNYTQI